MSQQKTVYTNQEMPHISNYKGVFETGANYEKFDFIYHEEDSCYYYARDQISNASSLVSGEYRFTLDPSAPADNGVDSYYIYDEWNQSEDLQLGQRINLSGSNSDGMYKITSIEPDFQDITHDNNQYTFEQIFSSEPIEGVSDWYKSDWFFKANVGQEQILDFTSYSKSDDNWIYHSLFGFIYVQLIENSDKDFFFSPEGGKFWFYASNEFLGNASPITNSLLYVFNEGNSSAGSSSWLYWTKSPYSSYKVVFYNYTDQQWYGFNSFKNIQKISYSEFEVPPSPQLTPAARDNDGKSTRITVQGVGPNSVISQYEIRSQNNIILSSIISEPSSSPDLWSKDSFFFDADYGSSVKFTANNYVTQFDNGYYTVQPKNINSLNFEIDLKFKNRTNREANAIIHFLESHQGQRIEDSPSNVLKYSKGISGFNWDGASTFHPYDSLDVQTKEFYCQEFSHDLAFENNNNLEIKLKNNDSSILLKNQSIFVKSAEEFSLSNYYEYNDVAFFPENNQYYYYKGNAPSVGKAAVKRNSEWSRDGGYFTDINKDLWTRDFFWKPSLGLSVEQKPNVNEISLGAGYIQIYKDGINQNLLKLNLNFSNRSDEEAYAILHFLEQHYGCVPFMFTPPAPYDTPHNFICQEWSHTYNYKNNHSVTALFEQFALDMSSEKILSISPPSRELPAEIVCPRTSVFVDENETELNEFLGDGGRIRKRIYLENIGDLKGEVRSLTLSSDEADFSLIGLNQLGSRYIPENSSGEDIDRNLIISSDIINDVFEDINGSAPDSQYASDLLSRGSIEQWTVADLVISIMNDSFQPNAFLYSDVTEKKINILYRDMLNRFPRGGERSQALTADSMLVVKEIIEASSSYANFNRNEIKIVCQELKGSFREFCVPDDKLKELNLNGKRIRIGKLTKEGQNFESVNDGKFYFQSVTGDITDLSTGKVFELLDLYFITERLFELYGVSEIEGGERGFIEVMFTPNKVVDSYLRDSAGNKIKWTDSRSREQGYIKIGRGLRAVHGQIDVRSRNNSSSGDLKCWVKFKDSVFQSRIDEETSPLFQPKNIVQAPFIRFQGLSGGELNQELDETTKEYLSLFVPASSHNLWKFHIASEEGYENNISGRIYFEDSLENTHDITNIWVPYKCKILYSDNGLIFPKGSVVELSQPIEGFNYLGAKYSTGAIKTLFGDALDLKSEEIILNKSDITSDSLNDDYHTILSIREMLLEEIPSGYSGGYLQEGLVKITFHANPSFLGSRSHIPQSVGGGKFYYGRFNCQALCKTRSMANIEMSVGEFASKYGILYDKESNSYSLIKKGIFVNESDHQSILEKISQNQAEIAALIAADGSIIKKIDLYSLKSQPLDISEDEYNNLASTGEIVQIKNGVPTICLTKDMFSEDNTRVVFSNISLIDAKQRWEDLTETEGKVHFAESDRPVCMKTWYHSLGFPSPYGLSEITPEFRRDADFYYGTFEVMKEIYDTMNNNFVVNQDGENESVADDNFRHAISRSSLPLVQKLSSLEYKKGLNVNVNYYIDLDDEKKFQIDSAVALMENIVNSDIDLELYIMESESGRLSGSAVEQNVSRVNQDHSEYLRRGLAHVPSIQLDFVEDGVYFANINKSSPFARRVAGVIGIDPEKISEGSFNQIVNIAYEPNEFTPLYYSVLHELFHMLGLGYLWSNNRYWWKDSDHSDIDTAYNLIENSSDLFNQYKGSNAIQNYKELIEYYDGELFNQPDYEAYVDNDSSILELYNSYLNSGGTQSKLEWGYNHWVDNGSSNSLPLKNNLANFYYNSIAISDDGIHMKDEPFIVSSSEKIQPVFSSEIYTDFSYSARAPEVVLYNQGAVVSSISIAMLKDIGYDVSFGPARPKDDAYLNPNINVK